MLLAKKQAEVYICPSFVYEKEVRYMGRHAAQHTLES